MNATEAQPVWRGVTTTNRFVGEVKSVLIAKNEDGAAVAKVELKQLPPPGRTKRYLSTKSFSMPLADFNASGIEIGNVLTLQSEVGNVVIRGDARPSAEQNADDEDDGDDTDDEDDEGYDEDEEDDE